MRIRFFLLYILFFGISLTATAQLDFGMWSTVELKTKISKKWSAGVALESRIQFNSFKLDAAFVSPSVDWKIHKHFEVGASYRLTSADAKSNARVFKHRYTIDFTFRNIEELLSDKSRFGLSLRLRSTTELEAQERTENTLRLQLNVDYDIKGSKLKPFFATEIFYRFNRDVVYTATEVLTTHGVNRYRVKLGCTYPIGKQHEISGFGLYQIRFPGYKNEVILGIGYAYEIPRGKKKSE